MTRLKTSSRCLLPLLAGLPIAGAGALLLFRYGEDMVLLLVGILLLLTGAVLIAGGVFANYSDRHRPLR